MAGKKDIVWVADQLVSTFQTYLTANLTALDAEYDDGITLETVPDENYFISEIQKIVAPPLVCVIPRISDTRVSSGEARYGLERHRFEVLAVLIGNSGEDVLMRRLGRTVRAVQEVIEDQWTLTGAVEDAFVLRKEYHPLISEDNALMKEGTLTVEVLTMNPDC